MDLDSIKGSPLFHELYDTEIENLLSNCNVITFNEGEFVIRQGEEGNELFLVLSGQVEVLKSTSSRALAILGPGDIFGEMVLINENKRSSSVRSLGESEILLIDSAQIFELFESNSKAFSLLIFNMARLLVKRLVQTEARAQAAKA